MATLLLRLAAPMQSWGIDSKFETRRTMREPSKSGVIGLLAAALGCKRDKLPDFLRRLQMTVRVDQEGQITEDFHAVHGIDADEMGRIPLDKDGKPKSTKKRDFITYRDYLCDAVFLVALQSDEEEQLAELADALAHPAFPLFLGRRSCPPTLPLLLGVFPDNAQALLKRYPWRASEIYKRKHRGEDLRIISDCPANAALHSGRRDAPITFHPGKRIFGMRAVTESAILVNNETEHDAFQDL